MNELGLVEIVGIVVVLALIAWPMVFFQWVRPWIMAHVGRWLGVGVHESTDVLTAGVYDSEEGAPLRKSAAVIAADFVVILLGVVGVVAAISIPLFLLVESGLPYRWEGQITGKSVRIGEVVVPPMNDRQTTARVTVRNEAGEAVRACQVDVAGYTARNGYLHGASRFFDLQPAASETVEVALSVMKPVPGKHAFRLNLECGYRMKDGASVTVEVGE